MPSRKRTKKLLNINQVRQINEQDNQMKNNPENLTRLNNAINTSMSNNVKIHKFLGYGTMGEVYLGNDDKKGKIICKVLSTKNKKQALMEIGMLYILSNNNASKLYVNPCIDYTIQDGKILTIFPYIQGKKLSDIKPLLKQIPQYQFENLVRFLIRNILYAVSTIHKKRIAHQNIDDSSILLDIDMKDYENSTIKLNDFGLGCGVYKDIKKNMKMKSASKKQVNNRLNDIYFRKCLDIPDYFLKRGDIEDNLKKQLNSYVTSSLKGLNRSEYLDLAQMYDIWCCGKLFYDLIHSRDSTNSSPSEEDGIFNNVSWYKKFNIKNRNCYKGLQTYKDIVTRDMLVPIVDRKKGKHLLRQFMVKDKY